MKDGEKKRKRGIRTGQRKDEERRKAGLGK